MKKKQFIKKIIRLKLFSIGDDKKLVEYDVGSSGKDELKVI